MTVSYEGVDLYDALYGIQHAEVFRVEFAVLRFLFQCFTRHFDKRNRIFCESKMREAHHEIVGELLLIFRLSKQTVAPATRIEEEARAFFKPELVVERFDFKIFWKQSLSENEEV